MTRIEVLIVLLLCIIGCVQSEFYYVDAINGSDSNSGNTINSAWKSFSKLNNILVGDDTAYLLNGNYFGSIYVQDISASTTQPITVTAYPGSTPVLRGSSSNPTIKIGYTAGVTISGLTFYRNSSKTVDTYKSSYLTVDNCTFIGNGYSSSYPALTILGDNSDATVVHHNRVSNTKFIGWNQIALVVFQASDSIIENNTCTGQLNQFCMDFYNTTGNRIRNNVITDSYGGISLKAENSFINNDTVIEGNRIERIQNQALYYRVKYGIIRNNYFAHIQNEAVYFLSDSGMATPGTKFYANTIVNASASTSKSGILMDSNESNDLFLGSFKLKNNVVMASNTTGADAVIVDYNSVVTASDFEAAAWEFAGNCLAPNAVTVQSASYTISEIQSQSEFQNWIFGNVLGTNSDFVTPSDPTSGLSDTSPCKLAQVPLTYATSTTNSNTITVADTGYFSDGNNITVADTIVIGNCSIFVEIDAIIDSSVIKLKSQVSVTVGDSVTLIGLSTCGAPDNESPKDKSSSANKLLLPIIIAAAGVLLILIAVVVAVLIVKKKKHGGSETSSNTRGHPREEEHVSVAMETVSTTSVSTANSTTLAPHQIKILEALGEGRFGAVYKGLFNKTAPVALKKLKSENKGIEFSREVALLSKLRHPNIIMFHGIWRSPEAEEYMVFEFVNKGNLLDLLQKEKHMLTTDILVTMCLQVACGMSYLEQMKIVHRDLAARNVLVKEESGTFLLKISDFGLSRQTSDNMYQGNDNELPVRWTAPEALIYNTHSHKSDVWSFGILMWEMFEFGKTPYPQFTNAVTRQKVVEGYRLDAPKSCPQSLCELMKQCWHEKPNQRPSFSEIETFISQLIEDGTATIKNTNLTNHSLNSYMNIQNPKQEHYN